MQNENERILDLEAKVYSLQGQVSAISGMVLGYFALHQVHMDRKPALQFNQEAQARKMDELLGALADVDPARASKIKERLESGKML